MTSGSGTCGRSATARCTAFPNGRSFARSPRRSRSTRSPISTSISTSSRRMRRSNGDPRALGARRRRAQPDRPRHPARPRRHVAHQEQVDAHRGVRLPALHGLGRHRGDRDRSRRAHPAARQRGSEPRRRARRAQAAHRRGRGIRHDDRHRPWQQRRPLPGGSAARGDPPADPQSRRRDDRRNFAVAETGTFVVCTNEGNADLSANVPKLHIASIGIEKIIPRLEHLAVFVRLLSRSALGSPITQYTSHFRGPRERRRDARRARRQRPLRASGHGGVLDLAEMHPLRRLHEHLPGLPPQRRPELRGHLFRPDRPHHRSDLQRAEVQQPAIRLVAQRQLQQCLPGEDQHPRADLRVAARARGAA